MEGYIFCYDVEKDIFHIGEELQNELMMDKADISPALSLLIQKVHPEDYEQMAEGLRRILQGKETNSQFQIRLLLANHDYEVFQGYSAGLAWKNGKPTQIAGILQNIDSKVTYYTRNVVLPDNLLCSTKERLGQERKALIMLFRIDKIHHLEEQYGREGCRRIQKVMEDCIREYAQNSGDLVEVFDNAFLLVRFDFEEQDERRIFKTIRQAAELAIIEMENPIFFTISVGVDFIKTEQDIIDSVPEHLKFALEEAGRRGRNQLVLYQGAQHDRFLRRSDILSVLTASIQDDFRGFEVYYQPIVDAKTSRLSGAEALLRWRSEKFGMMSPFEFIPILEESGLIIPVGRWVLEQALRQCKQWQSVIPDFAINVNVSYVQMEQSNILNDIVKLVNRYELAPETAKMEITESGEVENNEQMQETIRQFSCYHIPIALDDFGTGYSNIRYLRDIQPAIIKLDRSFVNQALVDSYTRTVIRHITMLAHEADIQVVFEGVETKEDQDALMELEPDYIQGYLYGRPIPAGEFESQHIVSTQG